MEGLLNTLKNTRIVESTDGVKDLPDAWLKWEVHCSHLAGLIGRAMAVLYLAEFTNPPEQPASETVDSKAQLMALVESVRSVVKDIVDLLLVADGHTAAFAKSLVALGNKED